MGLTTVVRRVVVLYYYYEYLYLITLGLSQSELTASIKGLRVLVVTG